MSWKDISEKPAETTAALVAVQVGEEEPFLLGSFVFTNGRWEYEASAMPLRLELFERAWWMDESQLFDIVPLPRAEGVPA